MSNSMKINPINPVVHQSIKRFLTKDHMGEEVFFDYDRCEYVLQRSDDEPNILKFGFSCQCTEQIMANGGKEMLDALYPKEQLPADQQMGRCNITLGIDTSNIAKTKKVSKAMSEEEADKVRAENEEIRKQREAEAEVIANRFACFKRDFLGAPIWKAMEDILNGREVSKPCQIDYRATERFWVFPEKNQVSVTFEVHENGTENQQLTRVFMLELADIKRQVQNCPGINFSDTKNPENVEKVFPGCFNKAKSSNGCMSFVISDIHMKKKGGTVGILSQLIGFRQYLHYHVTALKIQLHARMRKRVDAMELIVKQARRDNEAPKKYKEKHGGEQIVEAKEESKKEEVFKFR